MDDFAKHASSYQLDQEILEARGINMTVEEVAGLPTSKYSERVQSLHLAEDDLLFLKGLRRRIKNRLASQNSRRRNTELLRRLARELRALRACRHAALTERRALLAARGQVRERCEALREYMVKVLNDRSDPTEVPHLDPERYIPEESQSIDSISIPSPITSPSPAPKSSAERHITESSPISNNSCEERDRRIVTTPPLNFKCSERDRCSSSVSLKQCVERDRCSSVSLKQCIDRDRCSSSVAFKQCVERDNHINSNSVLQYERDRYSDSAQIAKDFRGERDRHIFECRIEKLVQQSVNHIYKEKKKITAKTVFITDEKGTGVYDVGGVKGMEDGVLNLSVKRRSHGRKQSAPRRITCVYTDNDDGVLDLKIKKESH